MTKNILYQIMPLLAMTFMCFNSIFADEIYLILSFFLVLPFFARNYKLIIRNEVMKCFFGCVFIGSIFNLFFTQNGIGGTINFFVSISLSLYAISNIRAVGYFSVALGLFTAFWVYYNLFFLGTDVNSIYESAGLSKNYPGMLMVLCCCVWGLSKYVRNRQMPLILPLVYTFVAFFLDGRSSLAILALLSVLCICFQFRKYSIISIIFGISLIYFVWDDLSFYYSFTTLSKSGTDTSRWALWSSYLKNLDLSSFFFGPDTLSIPELQEYNGNPHNAFLNFHSRMGILGVGALIYIIIKSVAVLLKEKAFMLMIFEIALLTRIFFDACIGSGLDCMIYTIIIFPILCQDEVHKLRFSQFRQLQVKKSRRSILYFIERFV